MFMPKKHRIAIYSYLFKEGVLSCQKDVKKEKHHEMDLPNLHVNKAMLSLKSRGYVREVFNWCVPRAAPRCRLPAPPSPLPVARCATRARCLPLRTTTSPTPSLTLPHPPPGDSRAPAGSGTTSS